MGIIFNLLVILSLSVSCTVAEFQVVNYQGNWISSTNTSEFSLNLSQSENTLTGTHCSVQQNGDKIDCGIDESDLSVSGIVNDPAVVTVTFTSFYNGLQGVATLRKIDSNTLEWKIITKPEGEYYIPDVAILTKQ